MKKAYFLLIFSAVIFSCKEKIPSLTSDFAKCTSNCEEAAVQLKDLYQQDPRRVLGDFGQDTALLRRWIDVLGEAWFYNAASGESETVRENVKQNMMMLASGLKNDAALKNAAALLEHELSLFDIVAGSEGAAEEYLPLTGTYAYELPNDGGNGELKVSQLDSENIRFSLMIVGSAPAHNQGMIEGEANFVGQNVAEFKTTEFGDCKLRFSFDREGVEIKTLAGDAAACGFGAGVMADNAYQIKSHEDPFLGQADAKMAKNLLGTWRSTDDPKSEIIFDKGLFTNRYDGSVLDGFPYQFYPKCPAMCNPVADTPCFSIFGQDIVCYTVVKADGKNLEISMVGGKGNTLSYVKQ
ncbi:MAG: hypothetical protein HUU01_06580 [Saprospiraceae bacterium]|nr:hypothetical protein [Saprospiraceae bacterium]